MNGSIFLTSFFSINFSGSKFFTSLAMRTGKAETLKRVIAPTPLRPASKFDHTSSLVLPEPQIRPMPVITTRRFNPYLPTQKLAARALLRVLADVINRITHALNFFGVFVRDLDIELFLEPHHKFNRIERVGAEVVNEPRVRSHFAFVYAELVDDYLFHSFLNGTFHFVAPPNENFRQSFSLSWLPNAAHQRVSDKPKFVGRRRRR